MKELDKIINGRKEAIFLDFEGTQFSQEIIAIGAIKINLDNKNLATGKYRKFKTYVLANDKVGPLVEDLTNINDFFLKTNGVRFKEALSSFSKFVGNNLNNQIFITYGNFDLRLLRITALLNGAIKNDTVQHIFKNYFDFAGFLFKFIKDKDGHTKGLKDNLKRYNLTFEGEEHDPLSDSINLMRLYNAFITQKNILFDEYTNTIYKHTNLPPVILKLINKLDIDGEVTKEDFNKIIEEYLK